MVFEALLGGIRKTFQQAGLSIARLGDILNTLKELGVNPNCLQLSLHFNV